MKTNYLKKCVVLLLYVFIASLTYAQSGSITGKVLDETNQPLPGASVKIKGETRGTSTDINGVFRLSGLSDGSITIVVAFIGYHPLEKTISLNGATTVEFKLQPDEKNLTLRFYVALCLQQFVCFPEPGKLALAQ